MAYRADLKLEQFVLISATHFYEFDHGQAINELVPVGWALKPGDVVDWECAQYDGRAEVVSCSDSAHEGWVECVLRKVS